MENQYPIRSPSTNINNAPSPTTFVQADPNTFKDLVQRLTGSSGHDSEKLPVTHPARQPKPPSTSPPVDPTGPRRSPFKLQDRRQTMRKLEIKLSLATIAGNHHSRHNHHHHPWFDSSPVPSPVTPLSSDSLFVPGSGSPSPSSFLSDVEKGFFLQPSPLTTPRGSDPPELLNLFPLTSPTSD